MTTEVPRHCIECDGGCGKTNPRMTCSRCHGSYYCSRVCQKKDWGEHKLRCRDVDVVRTEQSQTRTTATVADAINTQCPICLAHEMEDPVVLACRHGVCFSCSKEYQRFDTQDFKCPLCRRADDDKFELFHAMQLAVRAGKKDVSEEERTSLRAEALDELNGLGGGRDDFAAHWAKAFLLLAMESYSEAIDSIRDLLRRSEIGERNSETLNAMVKHVENLIANDRDESDQFIERMEDFAKNNSCDFFPPKERISIKLALARAHQGLQQWQEACTLYQNIFETEPSINDNAMEMIQLIIGRCRCLYELGEYARAIEIGTLGIEISRNYPGVYKYVALAHYKKGDIQKARTLLQRAAIYTTAWDEDKRQEAYDDWRKFEEELEE